MIYHLIIDKSLFDLRMANLSRYNEEIKRARKWLDNHPGHRLVGDVERGLEESRGQVERLQRLLDRSKIEMEIDETPSFRCKVCGKPVGGNGVGLGVYIHIECVPTG